MSEPKSEKRETVVSVTAPARRPVETIAFERDMLPELKPGVRPSHLPKAEVPPVHNPKFAAFARARAYHRWVIGQELSDKEFDAAIEASEKASVYR